MPLRLDVRTAMKLAAAWAALAAAPVFAAAGAQEPVPQDDPPPRQIDPRQLQPVDPSRFQIQDFAQLRPVRPETRERDPRLAVINWTAAYTDRERQLAAFNQADTPAGVVRPPVRDQGFYPQISERSSNNIRPVHMPVLLPVADGPVTTRAGGEAGLMLMTRAHFYDASWHVDGMSVHVGGSRLINHSGSDMARAADLNRGRRADGYRIVTNESGLTADFTRYGAAYTVTLECGSASDPRCADETYLRGLLGRLFVAGGNPEGEG